LHTPRSRPPGNAVPGNRQHRADYIGAPPQVQPLFVRPSTAATGARRLTRPPLAVSTPECLAMRAIFVMIKCEMGQAYRVAQMAADRIEELSELHSTSGQYDLLGKFYLEPAQDTGLFVTEKLQTIPGVRDTYTLIAFNAFSSGRA
jgi:DNA-binding Lrp family transcriptional regulator